MARINYKISKIDSKSIDSSSQLSDLDKQLITEYQVNSNLALQDNFVEINIFTSDNTMILSDSQYSNYSILEGSETAGQTGASRISINLEEDIEYYGVTGLDLKILYNFLNNLFTTSEEPELFYIESISPDRTELRLLSTKLSNDLLKQRTSQIKNYLENTSYFPELALYLQQNTFYPIVNIDSRDYLGKTAVVIKLYESLPDNLEIKQKVDIVEKVGDSVAFEVETFIEPDIEEIPYLRGPNFDIEVSRESVSPSEYYNYNNLLSYPVNKRYSEVVSLFNERGISLSIDCSDYTNFINFSSAEERLKNFKYKLELVETYSTNLSLINSPNQGDISGSRSYYEKLIRGIEANFDHYEKHLYYESGSTSWPKTGNSKPYENLPISATESIEWYENQLEIAAGYDSQNYNSLVGTIPLYLREDPANTPYLLFVHMIGQYFDNIWIYTRALSSKFDADNRLNKGVSKDLVEELLKNFGIKIYTSGKSLEDLFEYFIQNSYNESEEEPYITQRVNSNHLQVSQKDYQKEIYKRIYHNLPLLLKSKGTERGLRALIACFGIPSSVLKIKQYGGLYIPSSADSSSYSEGPFLGTEQQLSSSLDKIRIDVSGSHVEGNTLSQHTSIVSKGKDYTQDLHRIEVGFSPTDNIEAYIVKHLEETFNIDNYIGDPRNLTETSYPDLNTFRNSILEEVETYDLKDFVRYIKFFDNVLFRMIRDFVPARAVVDTGIIIKPHFLERSKIKGMELSGESRNLQGILDVADIEGGEGGSYTSGSTTAFTYYIYTPNEHLLIDRPYEEPMYNGELGGSQIILTDGELNRDNNLKNISLKLPAYNIGIFSENITDCDIQAPNTPYILTRAPNSPWVMPNFASMFSSLYSTYNYTSQVSETSSITYTPNYTFTNAKNYDEYSVTASLSEDSDCFATRNLVTYECTLQPAANTTKSVLKGRAQDLRKLFITGSNNPNLLRFYTGSISPINEIANSGSFVFSELGQTTVWVKDSYLDNKSAGICSNFRTVNTVNCILRTKENSELSWWYQDFRERSVYDAKEWFDFGGIPTSDIEITYTQNKYDGTGRTQKLESDYGYEFKVSGPSLDGGDVSIFRASMKSLPECFTERTFTYVGCTLRPSSYSDNYTYTVSPDTATNIISLFTGGVVGQVYVDGNAISLEAANNYIFTSGTHSVQVRDLRDNMTGGNCTVTRTIIVSAPCSLTTAANNYSSNPKFHSVGSPWDISADFSGAALNELTIKEYINGTYVKDLSSTIYTPPTGTVLGDLIEIRITHNGVANCTKSLYYKLYDCNNILPVYVPEGGLPVTTGSTVDLTDYFIIGKDPGRPVNALKYYRIAPQSSGILISNPTAYTFTSTGNVTIMLYDERFTNNGVDGFCLASVQFSVTST